MPPMGVGYFGFNGRMLLTPVGAGDGALDMARERTPSRIRASGDGSLAGIWRTVETVD